jgi:putative two-component system response regulator
MTISMDSPLRQQTVLIVDDSPATIDQLSGALSMTYRTLAALDGPRALSIAASEPRPDIILLDVNMPGMDGHGVLERLQAEPKTARIPVIFVSSADNEADELRGLGGGAVDYIAKPISAPIVLARVRTHLALTQQSRELEQRVRQRTHELYRTRLEIIRRIGRAAEMRDDESGLHVVRIANYARIIAKGLNLDDSWCELLYNTAPMHDVGKIGIPDQVLIKPTPLDAVEWDIVKAHPEIGVDIIGDDPSDIMAMARDIALNHHERWDGGGYPRGVAGETIPLSARIVAVADVFDTMTTDRPYRKAWPVLAAIDHIASLSGQHFDPMVVEAFRDLVPEFLVIMNQYVDHPRLDLQSNPAA